MQLHILRSAFASSRSEVSAPLHDEAVHETINGMMLVPVTWVGMFGQRTRLVSPSRCEHIVRTVSSYIPLHEVRYHHKEA